MTWRRKIAVWLSNGDRFTIIDDDRLDKLNSDSNYWHNFKFSTDGEGLATMMARQKELYDLNGMPNVDFDRPLGLRAQQVITSGIGDFTKSMMHEACELEDWTQWKPWSRQLGNKSAIERWSPEHLKEMRMEVIDLLAFVFNLCCLLGITWKMLVELYMEKMKVNIEERHNSGKY